MMNVPEQSKSVKRISIANDGAQANGRSGSISLSDDGQLIPFESSADNLIANDFNNADDIFVYNRFNETVELVSVAIDDAAADANSSSAVISGDGKYVSFSSFANNLVADDSNNFQDIFIRDLDNQTMEVVSVSSDGTLANGMSLFSTISSDGNYVAFDSLASNLVANDINESGDIFLRDRLNQTTELVTLSTDGSGANGSSTIGSISDDGRYISFESTADNLVTVDTNDVSDIFLYNRLNQTNELISVGLEGAAANGDSTVGLVSGNGGYVVYQSDADNLVADDINEASDIFIYNLQDGTTELVSIGLEGAAANGSSRNASISDDSRYVAFLSDADNLVADDTNSRADIFIRDLKAQTTQIINADSFPLLSGDAQSLVFTSSLANLINDDTNDTGDVFLVELDNTDQPEEPQPEEPQPEEPQPEEPQPEEPQPEEPQPEEPKPEEPQPKEPQPKPEEPQPEEPQPEEPQSEEPQPEEPQPEEPQPEEPQPEEPQPKEPQPKPEEPQPEEPQPEEPQSEEPQPEEPQPEEPQPEEPQPEEPQSEDPLYRLSTDSVHRFYNSQEGYHRYSIDDDEIRTLSQQSATGRKSFNDESEQFDVLTSNVDSLTGAKLEGVVPVYQFFNSDSDAYLYTTEQEEISFVETLDNYSDRGIAYYAFELDPTEIETIPVFRMLNTDTGAHFYTTDRNELDYIQDNLDNFNMENRGEAVFYVLDF